MQAAIMKILWNGVNVHKAHNKIKQQQQRGSKGIKNREHDGRHCLDILSVSAGGRTTNDSYAIDNTVLCCIPYKTYTAR